MREIKFRVWNKINKTMYHDWRIIKHTLRSKHEHDIIMQYTGQTDKNDKEIFEGDIIEFDINEWGGNDNIHIVSWDQYDAAWCWGGGTTIDMEFRKVIGNIYENPELLKSLN